MKKRLISLLLALIVLCMGVLFTGCDNGNAPEETKAKTTFEIINEALQKTENLESMDAQLKMEMNMSTEGMTMSVPVTIKMKAKDLKTENPILSMVISMSMFGQTIDIEMYQEDQWAYMIMDDLKYKTSAKEMEGEFNYAEDADSMLQQIPEELLKDVQLTQAEDGSQSVTVTFPEEMFAQTYSDFIESVGAEMQTDIEDVEITDAVVSITVANGYVTVYDIAFTMKMTVDGVSTATEVKSSCTYENPGQEVTITPPEGYQDFVELAELKEDILQ